ncbi:hypothetical protein IWW50_000661 [Coemansia erecta]|nr:hypothetical protein IWW50_000661 [Coemansia erecta]
MSNHSSTSESGQSDSEADHSAVLEPEDNAVEHYPRFMLPRASGMSTMGEIHALVPSPLSRSPAGSTVNLTREEQSSVYPATWHEYEDQFNYFYSCHFIEQDYYDYLAGSLRRASNTEYPEDNDIGSDEEMAEYSDDDIVSVGSSSSNADAEHQQSSDPPPSGAAEDQGKKSETAV